VKAAAASAAARISADRRKSQSADHEESGKISFDRCTHDNLSFYQLRRRSH
jgi:DNA-directed RNA polymerase subunit M/transcription elongation factor TFIIS